MAYFEDLSPYTYSPGEEHILNVGWLEAPHPFRRGPVPQTFALRLQLLLKSPCNMTRGLHCCDFCRPPRDILEMDPSYIYVWELNRCGSGEVRVKGADGVVFSAPTLVWHYVVEHQYQPPQAFIDAVIYATEDP